MTPWTAERACVSAMLVALPRLAVQSDAGALRAYAWETSWKPEERP
jgi:hypothetical protein